MSYRILAVNPGSTSTKVAVYEDENELWRKNLEHDGGELGRHAGVDAQKTLRKDAILKAIREAGLEVESLAAVVGRGGLLPPVAAGGYLVNGAMRDYLRASKNGYHASNLGALVADEIAAPLGVPAFIYDAVSADEMYEVAKITGMPEVTRQSFCHVLNSKATARKVAAAQGKSYRDLNFLVAHLGGGISISAHEKGRIVDSISDDAGPFAPERSGSLPLHYIVGMCYSGAYSERDMLSKLRGEGGLKAHLGVHDCRVIERMIGEGDVKAKKLYEAEAYQVAKGIGEMAPVLAGKIDAVILTGGVAHSRPLTDMIIRRVGFLAPVVVVPGENELEALALGALRILRNEETAHTFTC